ncbi:diacylglycerol/polyprenol kinase family protein [Persephonella sp.]
MRNLRVEIPRKLFHIGATLVLFIPLYVCGNIGVAVVSFLMLVVLLPVAYFKLKNPVTAVFWKAIEKLERKENLEILPGKQAFALAGGMLVSSVLFDEETLAVCIVSTAVYDGVATIFGLLFGRHKFPWGKSFEGTAGGVFFNTVFLIPFLPLNWAFIVSVFTAVVENLASWRRWYLDDNFLIPVAVGFFVQLLQVPAQLPQPFQPFC